MKKKLLVVLGGGGHTAQMLRLLDKMSDSFEYDFVVKEGDELTPQKVTGKVYFTHPPRSIQDNLFVVILKSIRATLDSLPILLKSKPKAIISAGPGLAVPLSYWAKMLGIKVIYLESWSRVNKKSTSGKLIYPIADLFFVQWPEMKKCYPKAIYAGRVA